MSEVPANDGDIGHGIVIQSSWSPGEPEHRRFIGGIQWREGENIPIVTLRCPGCGFLESYAPRA